ncbi:hypothetical protein FJ250_07425 [bacterium]|nr:hypothetical protein [bacterium]
MRRSGLGMLLLCLLPVGCAPDLLPPDVVGPANGWEVFHPLPGGYDLNAVRSLAPGSVWAVGDHGVIVHWDGATVRRVDSPVTASLQAIDGWSRTDIYACGGTHLLHYDGRSWDISRRFDGTSLHDVHCGADGRLFVGAGDGLWCRQDGAWLRIGGPESDVRAVWTAGDGRVRAGALATVWVVAGADAVPEAQFGPAQEVRDGDGDWLWLEYPSGTDFFYHRRWPAVWEPSGVTSSCEAIADWGVLAHTTNAGIHRGSLVWLNSDGRWIYGLSTAPDGSWLACGAGGTLMAGIAEADTVRWHESAQSIGFRYLNAFAGTGANDLWGAEWYGRVLHYDGQGWTRENAPVSTTQKVGSVQVFGDGWLVARGGDEVAVRSPQGIWTALPSPGVDLLRVWAVAPDSVVTATLSRFSLWDGGAWRDAGPVGGVCWGLTATEAGTVHALVAASEATHLRRWTGAGFTAEASLPYSTGMVLGPARGRDALWIAAFDQDDAGTRVYRHDQGGTVEVTAGAGLRGWPRALTELRPDDLFVLVDNSLWRRHQDRWSLEPGLPPEEFTTIWSHPDVGVLVEGHPTFRKRYPPE